MSRKHFCGKVGPSFRSGLFDSDSVLTRLVWGTQIRFSASFHRNTKAKISKLIIQPSRVYSSDRSSSRQRNLSLSISEKPPSFFSVSKLPLRFSLLLYRHLKIPMLLAKVLSLKCHLRERLVRAYKSDPSELMLLAGSGQDSRMSRLRSLVEQLHHAHRLVNPPSLRLRLN